MRRTRGCRIHWAVRVAVVLLALTGSVARPQDTRSAPIVPDSASVARDALTEAPPDLRSPASQVEGRGTVGEVKAPADIQTSKPIPTTLTISPQFVLSVSAAVIFGAVGLYCVLLLIEQIGIGGFAGVETHWGGFGGAGGGWRLTPALVYLIMSLTFIGCATALAVKVLEGPKVEAPAAIDSRTAP
jgi:hypothetical protein